jgi:hypothetical protein
MLVFGLFIGNIWPIDEKMIRKISNLHFSMVFDVQKLHFCVV